MQNMIPASQPQIRLVASVNHTAPLTMSSREIAELLDKQHSHIKISAERLAEKGVIGTLATREFTHNGNKYIEYLLGKRDSLILVAQNCPEFTARIVDRWQELEEQIAAPSLPNFADPVAAARAWADEREARMIAESKKAEIGSRREATAMNTASQAVKKASKLEIELDRSKQYATVKRMEMLYHGQSFNWRLLKSTAIQMGIAAIDVFDANYGTVKAYHADVWREAYALEIEPHQ